MTDGATETRLMLDLNDRVKKLSVDDKFAHVSMNEGDLAPPGPRTDEGLAALTRHRSDDLHSGHVRSMTGIESNAVIRAEMLEYGIELP
jgi:hypothetical protein